MMKSNEPIRTEKNDPVLFPSLGILFHLEPLESQDSEIMVQLHEKILAWFDSSLKWSFHSTFAQMEPFRDEDFEYISNFSKTLKAPQIQEINANKVARQLAVKGRTPFGLLSHGGSESHHGSPFSYRFYSTIPEIGNGPIFETNTFLKITFPISLPEDQLKERALEMAKCLRIKWGIAGYMYSGWEKHHRFAYLEGVYAHANRFWGYDVGFISKWMPTWKDQLRTINWLTFLGPTFLEKLEIEISNGKSMSSEIIVNSIEKNTFIQAGPKPLECDRNNLEIAEAYRVVDLMVRPLRATKVEPFPSPWNFMSTRSWLSRFEKRVD